MISDNVNIFKNLEKHDLPKKINLGVPWSLKRWRKEHPNPLRGDTIYSTFK